MNAPAASLSAGLERSARHSKRSTSPSLFVGTTRSARVASKDLDLLDDVALGDRPPHGDSVGVAEIAQVGDRQAGLFQRLALERLLDRLARATWPPMSVSQRPGSTALPKARSCTQTPPVAARADQVHRLGRRCRGRGRRRARPPRARSAVDVDDREPLVAPARASPCSCSQRAIVASAASAGASMHQPRPSSLARAAAPPSAMRAASSGSMLPIACAVAAIEIERRAESRGRDVGGAARAARQSAAHRLAHGVPSSASSCGLVEHERCRATRPSAASSRPRRRRRPSRSSSTPSRPPCRPATRSSPWRPRATSVGSVPVRTKVLPASGFGDGGAARLRSPTTRSRPRSRRR